jgi:hypothetical protein
MSLLRRWLSPIKCLSMFLPIGVLSGCVSMPTLNEDLAKCSGLLSERPQPISIRFFNSGNELRSLYWVRPEDAGLVHYQNLLPGQSYVQQTYEGHLWVAMRPSGKVAATFCGTRESIEKDFSH